jgi:hypothetical protein
MAAWDIDPAGVAAMGPGRPEDVGLLVQVLAGPADGHGEESFDVVVCTPRRLGRWAAEDGHMIGRHHLIVERFDVTGVPGVPDVGGRVRGSDRLARAGSVDRQDREMGVRGLPAIAHGRRERAWSQADS